VSLSFELWTDGACSGNPGPGGWAYILLARRADGSIAKERQGYGGDPDTTNNRMELKAAIEGLRALTQPTSITIHPDSSYLVDSFTKWLPGWQRKNWIASTKEPVKNKDLWLELLEVTAPHTVSWRRVKGHHTVELNNRADRLAVHARDIAAGRIPSGTPPD
jgi:ribonuclease HI